MPSRMSFLSFSVSLSELVGQHAASEAYAYDDVVKVAYFFPIVTR